MFQSLSTQISQESMKNYPYQRKECKTKTKISQFLKIFNFILKNIFYYINHHCGCIAQLIVKKSVSNWLSLINIGLLFVKKVAKKILTNQTILDRYLFFNLPSPLQ